MAAGSFSQTFECYSSSLYAQMAQISPERYEESGRILLPPSALPTLLELEVDPILLELDPGNGAESLFCGVLEFVSEEGLV